MNNDPNHLLVEDLSTGGRKGRILEEEARNEEMEEVETGEEEEEKEEVQRVGKSSTPLFDFLASNFPWLRELAGDNSETHSTLPSSFFFTEQQDRMFKRDKTQDFIEGIFFFPLPFFFCKDLLPFFTSSSRSLLFHYL
jgi:hypothetical protein